MKALGQTQKIKKFSTMVTTDHFFLKVGVQKLQLMETMTRTNGSESIDKHQKITNK